MKHEVKIGGKTFPLAFTLKTLIDLQTEIKDFDLASLEISVAKDPMGLMDLLYLLASSGAALEDKELDVSREWMAARIPASAKRMADIQVAMMDTISDGMAMETEEAEEENEVDVTLREIKKNSMTDG